MSDESSDSVPFVISGKCPNMFPERNRTSDAQMQQRLRAIRRFQLLEVRSENISRAMVAFRSM